MSKAKRYFTIFLGLLFIVTAYYPGLTGGFMLDDWGSLPQLFDTIKLYGFWYGVLDGGTGPTGRPLPLISFALQQDVWPNPYLFKWVNLIIHCCNAILILFLTQKIIPHLKLPIGQKQSYFVIWVTLLWACNPIQISTVLYVVQRMVLLSAFFTLLGILGYLKGRDILIKENKTAGYAWMFASMACFGSLAVFSKENGLLLVLFILALELTLLKGRPDNNLIFRGWKLIFLVGPFLAFIGYLLINFQGRVLSGYHWRLFSFEERLLTQPRILWNYIRLILMPQGSSLGLFHEDYEFSKGLLQPWTTLLAIVGILSSVFVVVFYRKRFPVISFAITWFLFGHAMESTIIPLELYFEHRNYLPSFSIVFLACYGLFWLRTKFTDRKLKTAFTSLLAIHFSLIFGITYSQASMWGNELEFALIQAQEHPGSIRARLLPINAFQQVGDLDRAFEEAKTTREDFPMIASVALFDMGFACRDKNYPPLDLTIARQHLKNSRFGYAVLKSLDDTILLKAERRCPGVTREYLKEIILALLENPKFSRRKNHLRTMLALIYLQENHLNKAINILDSLKRRKFDQQMLFVRLLATRGDYHLAIAELEQTAKSLSITPKARLQIKEIDSLKQAILTDLKPL
ncbi:MAG: hypothetical protein V3U75_08475 [Methylococcaceae bacterium]